MDERMDADLRACFKAFLAGWHKLEHRLQFVADKDGQYYTVNNELRNPRTGQWVPVTLGNIRDAVGEI